jgi:hypothetical protein
MKKLTAKKLSDSLKKIIKENVKKRSTSRVFTQKRTVVFLTVVALTLLSGFMFVEVMSALETSINVPNTGTISTVGVGAYWDSGCTNRTSTINWGVMQPGSQRSFTVYIRNEGTSAITLTQSTSNWNPSAASSYLGLAWNYNGQSINPGATVQVTFTLTVSASVTGVIGFSFDVAIVGTG